ncbi:mitochondrial fission regulator 2 isoform 1-T2 [Pholidichthys leucotaenia]
MSLIEDILHVLRMALEYFGVPPDMLVPVWDSRLCGQYRSIVRMIGTNVPLTPVPRVHFQVSLLAHRPPAYAEVAVDAPNIPSFADVMWVFEDEGDSFARIRNHLPPLKLNTVNHDVLKCSRPALSRGPRLGQSIRQTTDGDTLKKITALESELLKLRAQIALIVTAAPSTGLAEPPKAPDSPLMSMARRPLLTSTPRAAPPPPPPPPPCPTLRSDDASALKEIQEYRKNKKDLRPDSVYQGLENKRIPSMLDVLKDLNKVKLRSVKRSPIRKRRSKGSTALPNDPAALIAEALKKKFTQLRLNNSSDKENSLERSPFGSPEAPKVPQHHKRSQGHRHL